MDAILQLFCSLGNLKIFSEFFPDDLPPWLWLGRTGETLANFSGGADEDFAMPGNGIFIHRTAQVAPTASILGPAYIGPHCQIGHGSLLRGNVFLGADVTVGSGCEIKNSLLLDGVRAAHFNYVGDSILGMGSHLGAGAVLANLRLDGRPVKVHLPGNSVATGLRKLGSLLGDGAQVGCNAVLQPGTVLGRGACVHPCLAFGGYLPDNSTAAPKSNAVSIQKNQGIGL
jgi:NDP-sugar pyrophosphorylase family protein